jgi:hypothetical protein
MGRSAGFQQRVFVATFAAITDPAAIDAAELAAATEITDDLPNPVNFGGTSNFIDISDIGSRQDKQMLGTFSPGVIEFEVFRDDTLEAAYDALDDEVEYILFKFEGNDGTAPGVGDVYDAAHIQVGTKADASRGRGEAGRATVPAAVVGEIVRDAVIVA